MRPVRQAKPTALGIRCGGTHRNRRDRQRPVGTRRTRGDVPRYDGRPVDPVDRDGAGGVARSHADLFRPRHGRLCGTSFGQPQGGPPPPSEVVATTPSLLPGVHGRARTQWCTGSCSACPSPPASTALPCCAATSARPDLGSTAWPPCRGRAHRGRRRVAPPTAARSPQPHHVPTRRDSHVPQSWRDAEVGDDIEA